MFMAFFIFVPLKAWTVETFGPTGNLIYDTTFNALFKKQHNLEPWVKEYLQTQNGVSGGSETRMIGGKIYELYTVCKPHYCSGNVIFVFFESGGAHAWALLINDNDVLRFFGNPDVEMQSALKGETNFVLTESYAKKAVLKILKDPDSVTFGELSQATNTGACLTVNTRNSFGGYTEKQQVISVRMGSIWIVSGEMLVDISHELCLKGLINIKINENNGGRLH